MPGPLTTSRAVASPSALGRQLQKRHQAITGNTSDDTGLAALVGSRQGERLLRLRDVLAIVGMSRAHVYNLIKQGHFPRPIALGSNCARWVQSEVQTWVGESIIAARATPAERS